MNFSRLISFQRAESREIVAHCHRWARGVLPGEIIVLMGERGSSHFEVSYNSFNYLIPPDMSPGLTFARFIQGGFFM